MAGGSFERLLDAAPTAILVSDASGEVLFANTEASKLFAAPADELVGLDAEN